MYQKPRTDTNLYREIQMSYMKSLLGSLFYIWVWIQIIGYWCGIFSIYTYRAGYCIHLFFTIYELIIVWICPDKTESKRNMLVYYKLVSSIVIAIACMFTRPWWLNIFFLKNITYIVDFFHTKKLADIVNRDEIPDMENIKNFSYVLRTSKIVRYIPILIICYTTFSADSVSVCILVYTYIMAEIFS